MPFDDEECSQTLLGDFEKGPAARKTYFSSRLVPGRLSLLHLHNMFQWQNGTTRLAAWPQRWKSICSLLLSCACIVAAVLHLNPGIVKGPAPFYCSTWDTATSAPDELYAGVMHDYNNWVQYDRSEAPPRLEMPRNGTRKQPDGSKDAQSTLALLSDMFVDQSKPRNMADPKVWRKPKGVRVVAMIFFGRPHQVDLLDCYLQQNMAYHGGFLDQVNFIAHSQDDAALEWLDNLVESTSGYERIDVGPDCLRNPHREDCRYERIWERFATDPDTIYIKIDDDMIYIHEETIPRLVTTRLSNPHPYAISANLINSPITSWLHYHNGAIYPYLPEPFPSPRNGSSQPTWRASLLPLHPDDEAYQHPHFGPTRDTAVINSAIESDRLLYEGFWRVGPFPGHRWLPLSQNSTAILFTPMSRGTTDPWGPSVHAWSIAAQQHYSLLQNLENGTTSKYWIAPVPPQGTGLWNMQYTRYNLNFVAVWGRDVVAGAHVHRVSKDAPETWDAHSEDRFSADPLIRAAWVAAGKAWGKSIVSELHDDEKNITVDIPRAQGRPLVVEVQALAAHMHFHDQEVGMQLSDLLDRYRAFGNERVCAATRQKNVAGQENGLGWRAEGNAGSGWWRCPWVDL